MLEKAHLSRNDLIYRSPPVHGWEGWLLGNGSAGATIWTAADRLCIQFGHTDLIDTASDRRSTANSLRHAGQLILSLGNLPLFDPMYLAEFDGRLRLASGRLTVEGRSAFGRFSWSARYLRAPAVLVLRYEDVLDEPAARSLTLQRYGSRLLAVPWNRIDEPADTGLTGTRGSAMGQTLLVEHEDEGLKVALAARVKSPVDHHLRSTSHAVTLELAASRQVRLELHVAIGLPEEGRSASEPALAILDEAESLDASAVEQDQDAAAQAWAPSAIHLPNDPYWEQLWYLARYHLRACCAGRYPAFFINGPWGWDRDVRAWSDSWFHWNMHGSHQPIPELGDWDLFDPYVRWRLRQAEPYRQLTKELLNIDGLAMQDMQRPEGGAWGPKFATSDHYKYHTVCGIQMVLHLYRHWRFTGDERFLRDVLYPLFRDVLRFWRGYLETDESGQLHVPRSRPYEFNTAYAFRDCLTDHAHLRFALPLFRSVAAAAGADGEAPDLADWADAAVQHLAPLQPVLLPVQHVTQVDANGVRIYDNPFFFGEPHESEDAVYAIGWSERHGRWISHVETFFDGTSRFGAFCSSQSAFIFPCPLVTSDASPRWAPITGASPDAQRDWQLARNALRTIRRYPPGHFMEERAMLEPAICWSGHSLELPAFARLGLVEQTRRAMDYFIDRFQLFPQGMWNYHPRRRYQTAIEFPANKLDSEPLRLEMNPFAMHFAMEPQGIFTEALTLALLDCGDGVIRLFQAYDRDAWFRLPAWDGFWVTAQQQDGKLAYIELESRRGGQCTLRLPWKAASVTGNGNPRRQTVQRGFVTLSVPPGQVLRLIAADEPVAASALPLQRQEPRISGSACLGLLRRM